jgi:hypothetical protein
MILGSTIRMLIAGQTQLDVNHIPPFIITSAILSPIGCKLFATRNPDSSQLCESVTKHSSD